MEVMEGQSFELPNGKWLKIELRLDEGDLLGILAEWGAEYPEDVRLRIRSTVVYDILTVHAQLLTSLRAYSAGALTKEEIQILIQQLTARASKQKITIGLGEVKS